jgi:AcrR family transcriptional regulator
MTDKANKGWREVPVLKEGAFGDGPREERSDAAESRRRILRAARELFRERGVDVVSMHEIGRTADVGQGTLYRRFEHKGALCSALLRERVERFSEEVRARLEDEGEPALERIAWLLDRLADFTEKNAPLLGAIRDAAGGERRTEVYRSPFYGWLRACVVALLWRAVERDEALSDLDVECAADAVLAPLNIDLYLFQRHELGMEPERITVALRRLLLDGLRAATPGGDARNV